MPMISQTVLLAGVNDDAETLTALMRAFVETRIKPYYLHHERHGARNRPLPRQLWPRARRWMKALRGRVSGLAQPTYVLDLPGGHGKVPVGPAYLAGELDSCVSVEDPWGGVHAYPPA